MFPGRESAVCCAKTLARFWMCRWHQAAASNLFLRRQNEKPVISLAVKKRKSEKTHCATIIQSLAGILRWHVFCRITQCACVWLGVVNPSSQLKGQKGCFFCLFCSLKFSSVMQTANIFSSLGGKKVPECSSGALQQLYTRVSHCLCVIAF